MDWQSAPEWITAGAVVLTGLGGMYGLVFTVRSLKKSNEENAKMIKASNEENVEAHQRVNATLTDIKTSVATLVAKSEAGESRLLRVESSVDRVTEWMMGKTS